MYLLWIHTSLIHNYNLFLIRCDYNGWTLVMKKAFVILANTSGAVHDKLCLY